jgi:hypothetical protein
MRRRSINPAKVPLAQRGLLISANHNRGRSTSERLSGVIGRGASRSTGAALPIDLDTFRWSKPTLDHRSLWRRAPRPPQESLFALVITKRMDNVPTAAGYSDIRLLSSRAAAIRPVHLGVAQVKFGLFVSCRSSLPLSFLQRISCISGRIDA